MLVYLIGFMGSGKTTVGKRLAGKLGYDFIDLDEMIEKKYHITINNIFNKFDENAFRLIEQKTLTETFKLKNTVISTGGGTPCFFNNMQLINKHGTSVYLKMHKQSLYDRLINSKTKRPLLTGKTPNEILNYIGMQLHHREPYYLQSSIIIKGESINTDLLENAVRKYIP
ncbi:MAG: shikimate kinase [Bacteroidales bacterium]|nr:shikimate kinase [Bacteroidales bacterium]